MEEEIITKCKVNMDKVIENLRSSLATLRAGTVSPTVLDKVMVNCYGDIYPLKQLASIKTIGGTSLSVSVYDPDTTKAVVAGISKADLGVQPNVKGNEISINFPPLTGERRQEITKLAKEYSEQSKIALRNVRRDMMDIVKKDKTLSKDTAKDYENDIQKETDKYNKTIEELYSKKVKELETI